MHPVPKKSENQEINEKSFQLKLMIGESGSVFTFLSARVEISPVFIAICLSASHFIHYQSRTHKSLIHFMTFTPNFPPIRQVSSISGNLGYTAGKLFPTQLWKLFGADNALNCLWFRSVFYVCEKLNKPSNLTTVNLHAYKHKSYLLEWRKSRIYKTNLQNLSCFKNS